MNKILYNKINFFWKKYSNLYWGDKLDIRYGIIDYLNGKKFDNVLDLGGQTGIFSEFIQFNEYICIDKNELKNSNNNIKYIKSDFFYFLDNDDKKYDLILAIHIIEYIPKKIRKDFLIKLKNKLTDIGELILTDPNKNNYFYKNYSEGDGYYTNTEIKNIINEVFDGYNIIFKWWDKINIKGFNYFLGKLLPILGLRLFERQSKKFYSKSRTWGIILKKRFNKYFLTKKHFEIYLANYKKITKTNLNTPIILSKNEKKLSITLEYINGKDLLDYFYKKNLTVKIYNKVKKIGNILEKNNILIGDFALQNIILKKDNTFFIIDYDGGMYHFNRKYYTDIDNLNYYLLFFTNINNLKNFVLLIKYIELSKGFFCEESVILLKLNILNILKVFKVLFLFIIIKLYKLGNKK